MHNCLDHGKRLKALAEASGKAETMSYVLSDIRRILTGNDNLREPLETRVKQYEAAFSAISDDQRIFPDRLREQKDDLDRYSSWISLGLDLGQDDLEDLRKIISSHLEFYLDRTGDFYR